MLPIVAESEPLDKCNEKSLALCMTAGRVQKPRDHTRETVFARVEKVENREIRRQPLSIKRLCGMLRIEPRARE